MQSAFEKLRQIKNKGSNNDDSLQISIKTDSKNNNQNSLNKESVDDFYIKRPDQVIQPGNLFNKKKDLPRVPTGIKGFDEMIAGGYKKGSKNLISGGPGTGKTILAIEYIVNGINMFNETGVYISFDEKKESVYETAKSFGWDLYKLEREEKLLFVEYSPEQLLKILHEGGGLLDNIMSKYRAKRLVVDSISTFLMLSSSELGKRDQLMNFFRLLNKWGVTSLLINDFVSETGNELSTGSLSINFECDSIVQLYYIHNNLGEERKRLIEVYKMRSTNHITKTFRYEINEKGIDIMVPVR
jgi:circadian clock protein KaiC